MTRRPALCLSTRRGGVEGTLRTPFGMELAPRTTCGCPVRNFFCRIKNLDPKKSFSCAYGDHQDVTWVRCIGGMPKINSKFHVPEVARHMENRRPSRLVAITNQRKYAHRQRPRLHHAHGCVLDVCLSELQVCVAALMLPPENRTFEKRWHLSRSHTTLASVPKRLRARTSAARSPFQWHARAATGRHGYRHIR